MPAVPVQCPSCGYVGPAPGGIEIENSTGITVSDSIGTCPRCGSPAPFISGTYDHVPGLAHLILRGRISVEDLSTLRKVASAEMPPDRAQLSADAYAIVEAVQRLAPGPRSNWLAILAIVISIIAMTSSSKIQEELWGDDEAARPPAYVERVSPEDPRSIEDALRRAIEESSGTQPPSSQGNRAERRAKGRKDGRSRKRRRPR